MDGKKKQSKGPKGPPRGQAAAVGSATQALGSMSIGQNAKSLSLFPPRPPRAANQVAPGTPVELLTNLFKLSLTQKHDIYRYDVNIDMIRDGQVAVGVDRQPRKLSKEIRKMALEAAVREWLRQNPQKKLSSKKYAYVFDSNGSVVYALFNIFPEKSDKDSSIEFEVAIPLDTIVDAKLAKRDETFKVKLFLKGNTSMINMDKFFDHCKGIASDVTKIQECLRALNVILSGEIVQIERFFVTPISVFDFDVPGREISSKVLLRKGFSMSTRPTAAGPVVNVANSFNAFHEETDLISLLQQRFRVNDLNNPLQPRVIEELKKELKNKQIEATHINYGTKQNPHYRKYRVTNIEGDCLAKFTLVDKVNKTTQEITIKDYFKKEYNCNLKYPKLPCIVDKGRKIPIEVCRLIDRQRVTRKLTGLETAATIKVAALKPDENFRHIYNQVAIIDQHSQPLKDFGFALDCKPIEVTGRELVPTLMTGSGKPIRPNDGQYNVQQERFLKPARIGKWALAFLLDNDTMFFKRKCSDLGAQTFNKLYRTAAQQKGMTVGDMLGAREVNIANMNPSQIRKTLREEFAIYNENDVDHIIYVLSEKCPDYIYPYLQYLETIQYPSRQPGQKFTRVTCVKLNNYNNKIVSIPERAGMFVSNLLLKYNTKLGGINFALVGNPKLAYLRDGYIFISLDVCHPAPGDKLAQSIAAAVGMWDLDSPNRSYRTCIRVQHKARPNNATIEDVGEVDVMFQDILRAYFDKKRKMPTHIIIYRDGVSEGQLKQVLDGELRKIYSMLDRVYKIQKLPSLPLVCCMVVQKRHKVRFMRKQPFQSRNGSDYNIQPGTVVDSKVTHPTDHTFYIAPHKAIQGTSRPAHIYVIHDTIKISQDEAQSMTLALSYLSPRCTKSTSIPTPVNLADRAAERGKNLVVSWQDDNMQRGGPPKGKKGQSGGQGGDEVGIADEQLNKLNDYLQKIGDADYRNTLFYI